MECKDYREQFTLMLTDFPNQGSFTEDENHLAGCADCRKEFNTLKKIWDLMGEIPQPQPSAEMQAEFSDILADFKKEMIPKINPSPEWIIRLKEWLYFQLRPSLTASILLVAAGLISGYLLHQPRQSAISYSRQIDSLSSQVSEMKQLMMLSLLQDPSASKRIQAVAYTDEMSNVNLKVIDALFTTLNDDPNVNVRLATLEALVKLADEPKVREGLIRSINLQDSPLMQSAIADVMVKLSEKSSVQSLQELLRKKDLNKMVKLNIQKNIDKLI
jgi:hypothetical protein